LHSADARTLGFVLNATPPERSARRDYYRASYRYERPGKQAAPSRPSQPVLSPVDSPTAAQLEIATTFTGQDGAA
jgi:hypothetical protein